MVMLMLNEATGTCGDPYTQRPVSVTSVKSFTLALLIIQAALFNHDALCCLSSTSCHCLKRRDLSVSSNTRDLVRRRRAAELACARCTCTNTRTSCSDLGATALRREEAGQLWKSGTPLCSFPDLLVSSN